MGRSGRERGREAGAGSLIAQQRKQIGGVVTQTKVVGRHAMAESKCRMAHNPAVYDVRRPTALL